MGFGKSKNSTPVNTPSKSDDKGKEKAQEKEEKKKAEEKKKDDKKKDKKKGKDEPATPAKYVHTPELGDSGDDDLVIFTITVS